MRRIGLLVMALVMFGTGCLPDPHITQSVQLFERLSAARGMLLDQSLGNEDSCAMVGDVQTRIFGEPGLVEVQPAWRALLDASNALEAACGQSVLLQQLTSDTPASTEARQRWTQGVQREIKVACDHLREAATALSRPSPC